jgi:manganese/iron transport system ATP-binding protein
MSPHKLHRQDHPVLDVNQLNVFYNGRQALENITFQLQVGERVAVVGPNGAGKSTLFKVIAGVLPLDSGQVNIYGSQPDVHVCVSYIPQRSHVDWHFPANVADVVMMGRIARIGWLRWPRKRDWQMVDSALETVGLHELRSRQIDQLSGGQQQRMFIARALAQEAELMVMDEPLTGLDAPSRMGILELLDHLRKMNVTIMVATHELDEAAQYFDRVMLLNRRLLGFGGADQVLQYHNLAEAYGGRLRRVGAEDELIAIADTCCGEGEDEIHAH